ncbi:hypothetical protein BgiMline_006127 [Biomphalaria glabrata]
MTSLPSVALESSSSEWISFSLTYFVDPAWMRPKAVESVSFHNVPGGIPLSFLKILVPEAITIQLTPDKDNKFTKSGRRIIMNFAKKAGEHFLQLFSQIYINNECVIATLGLTQPKQVPELADIEKAKANWLIEMEQFPDPCVCVRDDAPVTRDVAEKQSSMAQRKEPIEVFASRHDTSPDAVERSSDVGGDLEKAFSNVSADLSDISDTSDMDGPTQKITKVALKKSSTKKQLDSLRSTLKSLSKPSVEKSKKQQASHKVLKGAKTLKSSTALKSRREGTSRLQRDGTKLNATRPHRSFERGQERSPREKLDVSHRLNRSIEPIRRQNSNRLMGKDVGSQDRVRQIRGQREKVDKLKTPENERRSRIDSVKPRYSRDHSEHRSQTSYITGNARAVEREERRKDRSLSTERQRRAWSRSPVRQARRVRSKSPVRQTERVWTKSPVRHVNRVWSKSPVRKVGRGRSASPRRRSPASHLQYGRLPSPVHNLRRVIIRKSLSPFRRSQDQQFVRRGEEISKSRLPAASTPREYGKQNLSPISAGDDMDMAEPEGGVWLQHAPGHSEVSRSQNIQILSGRMTRETDLRKPMSGASIMKNLCIEVLYYKLVFNIHLCKKAVETGHVSKAVVTGHVSKAVETGHVSKAVEAGHVSKAVETGHVSKAVETGHVSKAVETDQVFKALETDQVSKAVETDQLSKAVETDHVSKAVETGHVSKAVETGHVSKAVETDQVSKAVETDQVSKAVETDQVSKAVETGHVSKAVETGHVSKAVETDQVSKAVETDQVSKAVETDQVSKAVETDQVSKAVETDQVSKAVETGHVSKAVETGHVSKAVETDQVSKAVETDQVSKAVETGHVSKAVETGHVSKAVETDQVSKAVETDQVSKAVETDQVSKAVETDQVFKAVETDQVSKAVETDQVSNAVETDQVSNAVETDQVSNAVETDQVSNAVETDQVTNHKKHRAQENRELLTKIMEQMKTVSNVQFGDPNLTKAIEVSAQILETIKNARPAPKAASNESRALPDSGMKSSDTSSQGVKKLEPFQGYVGEGTRGSQSSRPSENLLGFGHSNLSNRFPGLSHQQQRPLHPGIMSNSNIRLPPPIPPPVVPPMFNNNTMFSSQDRLSQMEALAQQLASDIQKHQQQPLMGGQPRWNQPQQPSNPNSMQVMGPSMQGPNVNSMLNIMSQSLGAPQMNQQRPMAPPNNMRGMNQQWPSHNFF